MTLAHLAAQTRRHLRRLRGVAAAMLTARGEARPYVHVVWLGLCGLAALALDVRSLGWLAVPTLALFALLGLIVLFDAVYFIIPDALILLLLAFGAPTLLVQTRSEALAHVVAAVSGYAVFRLVAVLYEKLRGEAGLGMGDAKLFAAAGLWLGFDGLPSCLLVAVASAALSALIALRMGELDGFREPIPFGPHLALGFWLSWAVGPIQFGG